MLRSTFFRRLLVPYLVTIVLATGGVSVFAGLRLRSVYLDGRRQELLDDLSLMSNLVRPELAEGRRDALHRLVRQLGQQVHCRVTVVAADGRVLADNWANAAHMANHLERPEIREALGRGLGQDSRPSETVHENMLYIAERVQGENGEWYFLRLAMLLKDFSRELWLLNTGLVLVAIAAMVAAGGICWQFARRHTAPILELTSLANALSRGELSRRAHTGQGGELGTLAARLNSMADTLQGLLTQAEREKARLLAILSSMSEGVIATDARQNILVANEAAASMLGFSLDSAFNKPFWQIVRNEALIRAAEQALGDGQQRALPLGKIAARHVDAALCTFPARGRPEGLVIVVHDTTESVRYEQLRKEFVANVSHELRTPLTVIKGYVETLRDGALSHPVKGPEYLETIERHTIQLTNLVNDLLELSRLESPPDVPRRVAVDLALLAQHAADLLAPAAAMRQQTLQTRLDRVPTISGDPDYLERAIANLIDNAIKYTPPGGQISLSTRVDGPWAVVEVRDTGIGIPAEDIPRIFERFYRVDRSRSREMGGTGLGLSIVKHIVQAHGGALEVESAVGQGSTFRFKIPLPQKENRS